MPDPVEQLFRGLPKATAADRSALRRVRRLKPSSKQYLAFVQAQPQPTWEQLRARPLPGGEPFSLV